MEQLENIVSGPIPLERSDHLYRPGHDFDSLFVVRSGSVKVYMSTADGDEQIVGFHLPGELVGLDALATHRHESAAVAVETASACALPFPHLQELCHHVPGLRRQVNRLMGNQLSSAHQMLLVLGTRSAEGRVATFLLNLSERYKARGYSPLEFNLSMSRHDIANYLGLAGETVSRVFSRLHDDGLLDVRGRHVLIRAPDRLRDLISVGAGIVAPFGLRNSNGMAHLPSAVAAG